ncbi:MAG: c-type cytochrome domain-containing protein [Verrucomicrobiales bacterium]
MKITRFLAPIALLAGVMQAPAAPEDQPIYSGVIQKIIDSKCAACHNPEKKKGKLDMSTLELLMKGGDSGKPVIVPGKSAESDAIVRITLPKDHDDHMPPEDKPQPTDKEIAILKWWIDAGAKADTPIKDAGAPEDLKPTVLELAQKTVEKPKEAPKPVIVAKELDPATKSAVALVQKEVGASILQVAQSETGLMFTAINVADKFSDADLAKFSPLAVQMEDMNLARTKITDAGLVAVSQMKNLKRLRLENTAVTDAGLDQLKSLENLEYLNLFNTQITDAGLEKLAPLKKLKRLYVWQTKATKEGAEKLHAQNKDLIINLGWDQEVGRPAFQPVIAAKPPEPAPTAPAPPDPEAVFFAAAIQPVFNRTCTACHGPEKQKADMRLDSFDAVLKGGETGPAIIAGKPDESLMIKRLILPPDDDDHMPPKDKPQPTEKEIKLLKFWIAQGADQTKKVKELTLPDDLK